MLSCPGVSGSTLIQLRQAVSEATRRAASRKADGGLPQPRGGRLEVKNPGVDERASRDEEHWQKVGGTWRYAACGTKGCAWDEPGVRYTATYLNAREV